MANLNYVLLERVEVGETAVSSITFNSIPQTGYTDLKIVASARTSATVGANGYYYNVTFNGTSSNRSGKYLEGTGSAANSGSFTLYGVSDASDNTASTFSNGELYIPNYASANYKSASFDSVQENNATASRAIFSAGLWSDVAAITSVTFTPAGGNFVQYSTFSLYALAAVGTTPTKAPKATGGSIIQTDGTYWYHSFLASGTFTPAVGLTCDYLVVAGGGGGGQYNVGTNYQAGGGGAGGLRSTVTATGGGGSLESALALSATSYTVTIGAGGAGGVTNTTDAVNGSNSAFSSITSTGGGHGSSVFAAAWSTAGIGGSGGGTGGNAPATGSAGTANQGFKGGNYSGGNGTQGGGAGAVGANNNGITECDSNNYLAVAITGSSVNYAKGGIGASGTKTNGTPNIGNGGSGNAGSAGGGNGGSGIVVVRYLVA